LCPPPGVDPVMRMIGRQDSPSSLRSVPSGGFPTVKCPSPMPDHPGSEIRITVGIGRRPTLRREIPPMASNLERPGRRRLLRFLAVAGMALVLYVLAGFLLVPRLTRLAIEKYGRAALHREVTLREARFNPFTLEQTL